MLSHDKEYHNLKQNIKYSTDYDKMALAPKKLVKGNLNLYCSNPQIPSVL